VAGIVGGRYRMDKVDIERSIRRRLGVAALAVVAIVGLFAAGAPRPWSIAGIAVWAAIGTWQVAAALKAASDVRERD